MSAVCAGAAASDALTDRSRTTRRSASLTTADQLSCSHLYADGGRPAEVAGAALAEEAGRTEESRAAMEDWLNAGRGGERIGERPDVSGNGRQQLSHYGRPAIDSVRLSAWQQLKGRDATGQQ